MIMFLQLTVVSGMLIALVASGPAALYAQTGFPYENYGHYMGSVRNLDFSQLTPAAITPNITCLATGSVPIFGV